MKLKHQTYPWYAVIAISEIFMYQVLYACCKINKILAYIFPTYHQCGLQGHSSKSPEVEWLWAQHYFSSQSTPWFWHNFSDQSGSRQTDLLPTGFLQWDDNLALRYFEPSWPALSETISTENTNTNIYIKQQTETKNYQLWICQRNNKLMDFLKAS